MKKYKNTVMKKKVFKLMKFTSNLTFLITHDRNFILMIFIKNHQKMTKTTFFLNFKFCQWTMRTNESLRKKRENELIDLIG